jgi:two-component system, NarL family, sensor histidine kinase UhpB
MGTSRKTQAVKRRNTFLFKLTLLFLFIFYPKFILAQDPAIIPKTKDSLALFIKNYPKQDTIYVRAMRPYALKLIYEDLNFEKADSLANIQRTLSEKLKYGRGIYFSFLIKAIIATNKSLPREALKNFKSCLSVVNHYKLHPSLVEASLNNIAVAFADVGQRDSALVYAMRAIEVQEKNIQIIKLPDSGPYKMVGDIYKFDKKYDKAIEYYLRGLQLAEKFDNVKNVAICENSLGNIYDLKNQPQEAIKHYKKALELAESEKYLLLQTDALSNLGRMYTQLRNYPQALKYLNKNLEICKVTESSNALSTAYLALGEVYQNQKRYSLAEYYLIEAYKLNNQIEDILDKKTTISALVDFYAETGDFKNAYEFTVQEKQYSDSLAAQNSEQLRQDLISKYESDKKEEEIKILHEEQKNTAFRQKTWIFGAILGILLAGFAFGYVVNRNRLKQLQASQKLRNQIAADLHDEIGSTLSSISILSELVAFQQKKEQFNPEIMTQVSNDARNVIEKMDEIIWTINPDNDEFYNLETRLKSYAIPMLESKEIDFKFEFSQDLESIKIDMGKRRDIYLILKEAINNLVKYSASKSAYIEGKLLENKLIFKIIDTGIGFDTKEESNRNGQKNMHNRAKKIGADLDIQSEVGKGTVVILCINILT